MDGKNKDISGGFKISEDVIISVARLAALDVNGVACLDGDINKISKLRNNGPIIVYMIEDVAALDVRIRVKNGKRAVAVAEEVQIAVKENVQSMTGVAVARVNVIISGIVFDK